MAYSYSTSTTAEQAKAVGTYLDVSPKQSIEICNVVRGKSVKAAKRILDDAIAEVRAIPFKRFTNGLGHKRGPLASGRFAPKACETIKGIIASAEANATNKGLSVNDLMVKHICAQRGPKQLHYGRQGGRRHKRTHVEVVLEANKERKEQPAPTKRRKKED